MCPGLGTKPTARTGKFVLHGQYLAHTGTYSVFNLSHAVCNKQRIHCFNRLFSTANFPRSLTQVISTCPRKVPTFQSGLLQVLHADRDIKIK